MSESLKLDNVRSTLIRQEDTIIFSLIERAQFALNPAVYQPDAVQVPGDLASSLLASVAWLTSSMLIVHWHRAPLP
jgi:hypothetical protein